MAQEAGLIAIEGQKHNPFSILGWNLNPDHEIVATDTSVDVHRSDLREQIVGTILRDNLNILSDPKPMAVNFISTIGVFGGDLSMAKRANDQPSGFEFYFRLRPQAESHPFRIVISNSVPFRTTGEFADFKMGTQQHQFPDAGWICRHDASLTDRSSKRNGPLVLAYAGGNGL
jgi:hypothetical protein